LKVLLTSLSSTAASQSNQQLHQQQQQQDGRPISSWILSWLQAVTGPLAEAAAAAKADMPAVFAAMLAANCATDQQPARSNRFAQQTAAGRQLLLKDDDWLPLIIQAAAQAEDLELVAKPDEADDSANDEDAPVDTGEVQGKIAIPLQQTSQVPKPAVALFWWVCWDCCTCTAHGGDYCWCSVGSSMLQLRCRRLCCCRFDLKVLIY